MDDPESNKVAAQQLLLLVVGAFSPSVAGSWLSLTVVASGIVISRNIMITISHMHHMENFKVSSTIWNMYELEGSKRREDLEKMRWMRTRSKDNLEIVGSGQLEQQIKNNTSIQNRTKISQVSSCLRKCLVKYEKHYNGPLEAFNRYIAGVT